MKEPSEIAAAMLEFVKDQQLRRRPIAAAAVDSGRDGCAPNVTIVVCNDGAVFGMTSCANPVWKELPPIPGCEPPEIPALPDPPIAPPHREAHKHRCMRCHGEFDCYSPEVCKAGLDVLPIIAIKNAEGRVEIFDHCKESPPAEGGGS